MDILDRISHFLLVFGLETSKVKVIPSRNMLQICRDSHPPFLTYRVVPSGMSSSLSTWWRRRAGRGRVVSQDFAAVMSSAIGELLPPGQVLPRRVTQARDLIPAAEVSFIVGRAVPSSSVGRALLLG